MSFLQSRIAVYRNFAYIKSTDCFISGVVQAPGWRFKRISSRRVTSPPVSNHFIHTMSTFFQLVEKKFNEAKENKELFYFESTVSNKESNGVDFILTLVPALAKKPKSDKKEEDAEKPNPFLNPNPALVIKELDEHFVLLNKFAVIPNHLLVTTKGK
ncbi:hypothetical protein BD770DRAFT_69358 [Pilaira anomala]|nr:hypothetical protein BD770DRAFT_69358 [Pilaira anomala]